MTNNYVYMGFADSVPKEAILTYDGNGEITDSGIKAIDGVLNARDVNVGHQSMSASGTQVLWTNSATQLAYAPPWHPVNRSYKGGSYDRYYSDTRTEQKVTATDYIISNPEFQLSIENDEVVFNLQLEFVESYDKVQLTVKEGSSIIWQDVISVSRGHNDILLRLPVALHAGTYTFSAGPYGDPNIKPPVKLLGDSKTGIPAYGITYRLFTEKRLATESYVDSVVDKTPTIDLNGLKTKVAALRVDTDNNTNHVKSNTSRLVVIDDKMEGLIKELHTLRPSLVSHLQGSIIPNTHTLRLVLTDAENKHVDGVDIDLSALLNPDNGGDTGGGTNPAAMYIYGGFNSNPKVMSEVAIKKTNTFSQQVVPTHEIPIHLQRTTEGLEFMWVWVPKALGDVKGMQFKPFLNPWRSFDISVDGEDGALFYGDYPTYAKDVSFEVFYG